MITDFLRERLNGCILDALRHQAYSPPNTPDTSVRDAYFTEAAGLVAERIKAEGWVIVPPKTRYRGEGHPATLEPSDITPARAEEDLHNCIRFALLAYRYRPPRSRDPAHRERWLGFVADAVGKQILMSNWTLVAVLQKLAPTLPHSCPPS